MSKNLTQLAQDAIDALNAYTEEHKRQKAKWQQSGYAAILNSNTLGISDAQEIELLTAIVDYDEDPAGTLQEILWQAQYDKNSFLLKESGQSVYFISI
jgi:hypothetical protein